MKNSKIKFALITLGLLVLVGCKPPAKTGARSFTTTVRNDVVNGNTGAGNDTVFQNQCASGQTAIGSIFDASSSYSPTFEQNIKSFLSATTLAADVGTISSSPVDVTTGVRFQAVIKLDQGGRVVLESSKIAIKIYDSFVASQNIDPISVTINTASEGQFNLQTGVGSVTYKDSYGEIQLEGQVLNGFFKGSASYTNYKTVVENASASSGQMGQFAIATCGAIQK